MGPKPPGLFSMESMSYQHLTGELQACGEEVAEGSGVVPTPHVVTESVLQVRRESPDHTAGQKDGMGRKEGGCLGEQILLWFACCLWSAQFL